MNNIDFDTALIAFANTLEKMLRDHHQANGNAFAPLSVVIQHGPKYVRIVREEGSSRSAYCFINKENGDILKPAGFKGPAKHARGNIYNENPIAGCGPYGVAYLR